MTEETIYSALQEVIDPEIGIDIVNLGLIYSVEITGNDVTVKMTLTTRGCPLHQEMVSAVERKLSALAGIGKVNVEIVWEPPWTPDMMSDAARARLQ